MNGNSHFVMGAAVAAATAVFIDANAADVTLLVSTCLIGSIFPDIDNPESHFGKLSAPASSIIAGCSRFTGHTGSRHRGIFHDIGIYIIGLWLAIYKIPFLVGFFLGAISHLLLDSLTPAGVPMLFGVFRFRIARLRSDGAAAKIITWLLSIAIVVGAILYKRRM